MGSMEKKVWFGITLLIILLIGTSFAWWYWNSTTNTNVSLTVDGITVNYIGGADITDYKLIPVSSKEKGIADKTSIEKVVTASATSTLYMNLYLTLEIFPTGLKDKSLVWELYNGSNKVGSGDFANANQGDVITLASNQEITSTESSFQLYIWIDGTQDNPSSMMNQTFKFVLSADGTEKTLNTPDLVDGLIPVMYSGSNWVKASSENDDETYQWYDYNAKKWANAVLVSSTNRSTYKDADPGVTISESDILAYYVWIPRYKYKVWNINKTIGTDIYSASTKGIDIVFEKELETTGTIKCGSYSFAVPTGNTPNETCIGSNGDYYTHPAFTFGDTQLRGIWIGKFEVSNSTSQIKTKPNVRSLRSTTVSAFSSAIQNMQASGNSYGLTTDRTKADSHMLKNMEWGAVAYLTNSDYGRCSNNSCTEVTRNGNVSYYTGGNDYITNVGQSTTGNIYGIYDMSGGAWEYVMGNMSSGSGSYTYNARNAGSNFTYSLTTAKYIDTYAYGSSATSQADYNRARLGDATSETAGWYSDYAHFPYSSDAWFTRGGGFISGSDAGPFNFNNNGGAANIYNGARSCLVEV